MAISIVLVLYNFQQGKFHTIIYLYGLSYTFTLSTF
jgi:hypothetical protein